MDAYRYPHAAIATPHYLATVTGLNVLMSGGNAVDAGVAANLVLAVACPHLCGTGGDLFALVYSDGEVFGLNSSGRLPKAAQLPADGRVPVTGIGAATVPGAAAGWVALAERFCTRSLSELAAPAIRYAREGLLRSPMLERSTGAGRAMLAKDPWMAKIFLANGPLVQSELADTLEDLESFYTGRVARNAPAPFTPEDFAEHRPEWVEPLHTSFAGNEVYEMPPNSRGHLVIEALQVMESLEGLSEDDPEFHLRMIRAVQGLDTGKGDTVYLCVHDENGMAVSINESNYMGWGSFVMIPETGVHLHNRGAFFTPKTYKGGARPIHTLAPGMALRNNKPRLVFGTMGGEAQVHIHMQLLARILQLGQDPAYAISAPRWVKNRQAQIVCEPGLPDLGLAAIDDTAGHANVISIDAEGLAPAADPRSEGLAAGY